MLLVVSVSFIPLIGFSIFGLFLVLFPNAALMIQNFNGSMKGNLFNNKLEFRASATFIVRITGYVFILLGIGIFLLINGWLDSFIL